MMATTGTTSQPVGHYEFCLSHARECSVRSRREARVALTPNRWNALVAVNAEVNRDVTAATDEEIFGRPEVWAYPRSKGDCEDLVLLKRRDLIAEGWPAGALLITVVRQQNGEGHAVLTVLNSILLGGRSSRLHRLLVSDGEIAAEVRGSIAPFQDPGLYEIWVSMREGHPAAEALAIVERELAKVIREGVTRAELEKAKNRLELSFLDGLETASGRAEQIGFYEVVLGDPSRVFARLDEYRRVTAADVRRAAARYFDVRRRTTILVLPEEGGADVQQAAE